MTHPVEDSHDCSAATHVTTFTQLAKIASDRAWRFSTLGAPKHWTPLIRILTWPILWPLNLTIASIHVGQIRILSDASVTMQGPSSAPHRQKLRALKLVGLAAGLIAFFGPLLTLTAVAAFTSSTAITITCAALVAIGMLGAARQMIQNRRRVKKHPESADSYLTTRRNELGGEGAPSYVLTHLVAHCDGKKSAHNLVKALQREWHQDNAVVVLFPATESLVRYYEQLGAHLDDRAGRLMVFS